VICCSDHVAGELSDKYHTSRDRIRKIPCGVIEGAFRLPDAEALARWWSRWKPPGSLLFAYVGRLDPEKGIDVLLRAFASVAKEDPRVRLLVAGTGKLEDDLKALAASLGVADRVFFPGYQEGSDLICLYKGADVLVVPSTYEPFGIVPLEGMVSGTAVIVSDTGGLSEIVEHGISGLKVPPGDPRALADAMKRLASDDALRAALAEGGKKRAGEVFNWERVVALTDGVYREVLDGVPAGATTEARTGRRKWVSIVLVTYGQLEYTKACLDSIFAGTSQPFELILLDNGSEDGTPQFLLDFSRKHPGTATVVMNSENAGYVRAANQGMGLGRGDYVLLLNNDTRVEPGWLENLVDALEADPKAGISSPLVLDMATGKIQSAGGVIHKPDGSVVFPLRGEARDCPQALKAGDQSTGSGPCMLVKRSVIEKVGFFDEGFSPAYFEDSDLCYRARQAGFRILYVPSAVIHHAGQVTTADVVRRKQMDMNEVFRRNAQTFFSRWMPMVEKENPKP